MRIDPSMVYRKFQNTESDKTTKSPKGISESSVKEGDVLKGEVVDASQSKVTLRLSDGQTITARLATANMVSIGDTVAFTVKESGGDQLLLSPLLDSGTQSADQLLNILTEAGLPKTEETMDMVRQLMDQKMPVDQKSLKTMVRLMTKYPETPVRQLVFLTKHQLPVNASNIQQLQMLESNEQPLMRQMASMVDDLSSSLSMKTVSMTSEQLPMVNSHEQVVLSNITEDSTVIIFQKEINQLLALTSEQIKVTVDGQSKASEEQIKASEEQIKASGEQIIGREEQTRGSEGHPKIRSAVVTVPVSEMLLSSDAQRLGNELVKVLELSISGGTLTEGQKAMIGQLPEFDQITLQDFGKLADEGLISHEQLRTFLIDIKEGSTYQALAKGLLLSDLKVIEDGDVNNYFKKVQEKVELLLQSNVEDVKGSDVAKSATNIKASVEFLNGLQQDYNFMQLPMFLNDQLLNSEFYVLNNQKASKDNKQSITALIRLDLKNLGHTDIYVKKTDKNVDVQFFMTEAKQMDVMRDQVFQLHKLLTSKGFNVLSATVQSLEKEFDIVDDFLGSSEDKKEKQRYTFDMRA